MKSKSVNDLKEGDRIYHLRHVWVVGEYLPAFDSFTVRITATPDHDIVGIKSGEYTTFTFGKEVVLPVS